VVDSFFLARTFVTLLVITDPVGTVPVFISMTTSASGRERNRAAWQAVLVAGLVIATFALFGQQILLYLDISLPSLQAAGGLLLLVVALDLLRGDVGALAGGSTTNIAFVPLGTPLLAGPGAIAAVMVFARQADRPDERLGVALGLVGVLAVLYLSLRFRAAAARAPSGRRGPDHPHLGSAADRDRGRTDRRRRPRVRPPRGLAVRARGLDRPRPDRGVGPGRGRRHRRGMRLVRIRQLPWARRHPFRSWTPPPQRFVQLPARHSNARSPVGAQIRAPMCPSAARLLPEVDERRRARRKRRPA
jgi:multiple antibiotic resistance protein